MKEYLTKMNKDVKDSKDTAAKRIVDHVTQMVKNGDKNLEEGIEKGKRTVSGMMSYITEEAHKQAVDGRACIEDDVVYGWAVHYLTDEPAEGAEKAKGKAAEKKPTENKTADGKTAEAKSTEDKPVENKPAEAQSNVSDKKPTESVNEAVKPEKTAPKATTKAKPVPKTEKQEPKNEESVQLSLFDML